LFRIVGDNKYWAYRVDREFGNYDYLMFSDIDHNHPDVPYSPRSSVLMCQVRNEMEKWALWIVNTLGFDGFRFDAVKHFSEDFLVELVDYLGANSNKNLFFVGNPPSLA
jgi:alpha-amylase